MEQVVIGLAVLAAAVCFGRLLCRIPVPRYDPRDAYQLYLDSPAWQALRARRLVIDHHRCQGCGASGAYPENSPLHVHHVTYERFGNEWLSDLVTVCQLCHKAIHARQKKTGEPLLRATIFALRERAIMTGWASRQRRYS